MPIECPLTPFPTIEIVVHYFQVIYIKNVEDVVRGVNAPYLAGDPMGLRGGIHANDAAQMFAKCPLKASCKCDGVKLFETSNFSKELLKACHAALGMFCEYS